ncbi:MAG: histidine kinase [Syntrophorhabdus aromaticivorans]|uniref:histidine kinase n=1 Tax=Syntrophorhabdus aromaticivorans TaxID=328301 RepID=A0A971M448_9BACT|nr:histidine kinase [Syntrophorhabdus aromaticivorans]
MESPNNSDRFGSWLERAVCTEQFKDIVQGFSSSFDFVVSFFSGKGLPLDNNTVLVPPPCSEGQGGKLPERFCLESIREGVMRSINSNRTLVFRCFCGAGYLAVPIIVGQYPVGCIVCGQFLFNRYGEDELALFLGKKDLGSKEYERLVAHFRAIPVVGEELIGKIRNRLVLMASYIVKMYQRDVLEARDISGKKERKGGDMEFENSLKILQAKDLRSQLNPHFLFNTLNAISQLAMLEGAEQTQELTYQLSEYLRYVLRKQSRQEVVTLSMEIECIKRYLEIYRIRFRERLSYKVFVGRGAEKAEIPFMLLQPIVENSVLHGIEPLLGQGNIRIVAKAIGSSVLIEIKDNGVGCDTEKLNRGIGLQNVRDRMSLHYGLSSDLEIKSEPGGGTSVLVRIPFEGV